jgi:hypothetical protein
MGLVIRSPRRRGATPIQRGFNPVKAGCLKSRQVRSRSRVDPVHRDPTAWLGMKDSNSEMSSQNIPLKGRADFRECSRILTTETIRV